MASNSLNNTDSKHKNKNKNKKLTLKKEFLVLFLINIYEYILGIIIAFSFNQLLYSLFKFNQKENVIVSFVLLIFSVSLIIAISLMMRKTSMFLPIVKDAYRDPDFHHPSPVALMYSLWRMSKQIRLRTEYLLNTTFF